MLQRRPSTTTGSLACASYCARNFARHFAIVYASRLLALVVTSLGLLFFSTGVFGNDTVAVWSESVGEDFEIFGSFYRNDEWKDAVRLVSEEHADIQACAMPLDDGHGALVVWTKLKDFASSDLYYLLWQDGESVNKPSKIDTGLKVNTGVSMVKDRRGRSWIAWAGFDGSDDEIFVARFESGSWSEPQKINADDALPDVVPSLGLNAEGEPWLSWLGLGEDGYRRYFSQYDGRAWSEELELTDAKAADFDSLKQGRIDSLALPASVVDPGTACVTVLDGHTLQSVRFPRLYGNEAGPTGATSPDAIEQPQEPAKQ